VLAGGSGTRFWPASRQSLPKPFVRLLGGETPLHATLRRLERLVPRERIRVVVGAELGPLTLESVGDSGPSVLLEPQPRDTAAAIVYAAAVIAGEHPDACVGVFPADHHIPDPEPFVRDVNTAAAVAAGGDLVLIGIEPTRPDTAYGYIKLGPVLEGDVCRVARFTEKPDRARARRFLRAKSYLWNAGMVVAPALRIVEECEKHAPEVWEALGPVLRDAASGRSVEPERLGEGYRGVTRISFDHAVLERSRAVAALPGRFPWSDLGSWDALAEHLPELDGNRISGVAPAVNLECSDNVIWNTGEQTLALVGVSGLAVVVTQDALLICPKERAQEVRKVVDALRAQGRADLT
jgi:mannose-1-phosphate guanylyltransferase/mannose-6-phosphate isomerase